MGCNCKHIRNAEDFRNVLMEEFGKKETIEFRGIKEVFSLVEFYFYYMLTSVINYVRFKKLEPTMPNNVLKNVLKYQ